MSLLSNFGFNLQSLSQFGFDTNDAFDFFGEDTVTDFISEVIPAAANLLGALTGGINVGDYFDVLMDTYSALPALPGLQEQIDVQQQLADNFQAQTGYSYDDIFVNFNGDGTVTGTVNGVGSSTVNINDAINTALSDPAIQDQINNALDTANAQLPAGLVDEALDVLNAALGTTDFAGMAAAL
jgi:hypothetical protein